jgi:alkylation response protein AidB-like acyl-CoA dehydrogenase
MPTLTAPATAAEIVKRIEPVLRQYADQAEAERRLAPEAAQAMFDAGVFGSLIPRALGGLEMDEHGAFTLYEEIARIDGSAGWLAANQSGLATLIANFPASAVQEMTAGGRSLFAGALFPPGMATPVEGGFRVTGQWPFGSGSDYANWMMGAALEMGENGPRMDEHGQPVMMAIFMPAREVEVLDTWHTLGMRGTGSKDIRATDVFVPTERTWVIAPNHMPEPPFTSSVYRLGFWPVAALQASVGFGIARAALDDFIALASKMPAYTMTSLGDRHTVQDRVARCKAQLEAARAYVRSTMDEAREYVSGGALLSPDLGLNLALAGSFGMDSAREVVDTVHGMAGTSAIRNEFRFQRYLRDIHTLTQHAFSSTSRYESIGKLLLGRETDWAFFMA